METALLVALGALISSGVTLAAIVWAIDRPAPRLTGKEALEETHKLATQNFKGKFSIRFRYGQWVLYNDATEGVVLRASSPHELLRTLQKSLA